MIPWKLEEWNGFYGTDYKEGLIIKKEAFFSRLLKKKGKSTLHLRSNYTRRKKWNKSKKDMVLTVCFLRQLLQFSFKNVSSLKNLRQARCYAEKTLLFDRLEAQLVYWGIQSRHSLHNKTFIDFTDLFGSMKLISEYLMLIFIWSVNLTW